MNQLSAAYFRERFGPKYEAFLNRLRKRRKAKKLENIARKVQHSLNKH